MRVWRLIRSGHLSGAMNMAIDEAIMHSVAQGAAPALRFYGWDPPAISIGYFQDAEKEVDFAACKSVGVDVVRRPTGGRAVLHDVEVTYSLAIPEENPIVPKGITESYRKISEGMVLGLRKLGLDAEVAERASSPARGALSGACFDAPSWYEVTAGGKKIVGSAQVRRMGVLLQHGSILLDLDAAKLFTCLRFPSDAGRLRAMEQFLEKATSVWAALGRPVSFMETSEAVAWGLAEALGVEIYEGELTPAEKKMAEQLAETKYSRLDWKNTSGSEGIQTA